MPAVNNPEDAWLMDEIRCAVNVFLISERIKPVKYSRSAFALARIFHENIYA